MDRLFVVDITALLEYGADGELIRYICEHYISKALDRVVYTGNPSCEKSVTYRSREYRVIPITSVEKTEEYLRTVYGKDMPPVEVPQELRQYRPDYSTFKGSDIPKDKLNSKYFIKRIDKLKSWNSLLYDGDVSSYIKPDALYSVGLRHNILSEWRIFVYKGEVMACQNYLGEPMEFPDPELIKLMIYQYKDNAPSAYTLDVAVTANVGEKIKTIPLEVHPFVACGLYGFEDKVIPDMWDAGFQWYLQQ